MQRQKGGIEFIVLAIVILASFILVGGNFAFNSSVPQNSGQAVNIQDTQPPASYNTLQIRGLSAPSPSPTPTAACPHDNGQTIMNSGQQYDPNSSCICPEWVIGCTNKSCSTVYKTPTAFSNASLGLSCNSTYNSWCSNPGLAPTDGIYCLGKPVIYLYPQKDTIVNVALNIPGKIVESIPQYPQGGWKNILAHPNGTFEYNGNAYSELYYESSVTNVTPPKDGFVVETKDIKQTLISITNKLGLIPSEQEELVDYWLPRVDALNSPYVFVSVIDNSEKQKIDRVNISPKPDTMIDFLLYFKPENKPVKVTPLNLPQNPPKRIGFTAVEWGGTIDNN